MIKELRPTYHTAQYYETDQMGIIHNSNYFRWFEECRTDFMNQLNLSYSELEKQGIYAVVLASYCEYKHPVRYEERVQIKAKISHFSGYKMTVDYEITNAESGQICVIGYTKHGLLSSKDKKPVRLERIAPEMYRILNDQCEPAVGS